MAVGARGKSLPSRELLAAAIYIYIYIYRNVVLYFSSPTRPVRREYFPRRLHKSFVMAAEWPEGGVRDFIPPGLHGMLVETWPREIHACGKP